VQQVIDRLRTVGQKESLSSVTRFDDHEGFAAKLSAPVSSFGKRTNMLIPKPKWTRMVDEDRDQSKTLNSSNMDGLTSRWKVNVSMLSQVIRQSH